MQTTPYQIELLQHTLGLSEQRREPYRNHFVAGCGHNDLRHLEALERAGLMERRRSPRFLADGDIVFAATEAGREVAIAALPAPRKRTRYEEYLDADGGAGDSFGEFLCGGRLPVFEQRLAYGSAPRDRYGYEYRMYRVYPWPYDYRHDVMGDWCGSKKEAKASYKAALRKHRARSQAV